jgi:hypothetical protein
LGKGERALRIIKRDQKREKAGKKTMRKEIYRENSLTE